MGSSLKEEMLMHVSLPYKDCTSEPGGLSPYQDRWPNNHNISHCKDHRQVSVCMHSIFHQIISLMLHRKNKGMSSVKDSLTEVYKLLRPVANLWRNFVATKNSCSHFLIPCDYFLCNFHFFSALSLSALSSASISANSLSSSSLAILSLQK